MTYLDLFSGIGGFHLGLEWAGFKFDKVFYSEIDNYANKVYKKNFPDAIPLGDITKINPEELPSIDIVTAGFPCQDISVAGKQEGINAKRSGLFYEIIRLCGVLRPKIIFLENVPNLISGDSGRWFKSVLESIAEIGYDAEWQIISAKNVGAQHLRKRVWIIAYPDKQHGNNGGFCSGNVPQFKASGVQKSESSMADTESKYKRSGCMQQTAPDRMEKTQFVTNGRSKRNAWSIEPSVGRVANGIPCRVDRLKGLGNAVVPQVVQLIGGMILDSGLLN